MTAIKISSSNQLNKKAIEIKCPVAYTLHKIGGRWKARVINQLIAGGKRYNELRKALSPITEKMLIQTLKELESDGIITRHAFDVIPPHVEYDLTELGHELKPVLMAMIQWGLKHNKKENSSIEHV
jgi:DNA-binding HxlR family transcriptional regulator